MLGLSNQDKLLPPRYCPIQIELELLNSQAGAVSLEVAEGFSNGANLDINSIQCKCDLLTLDNSMDNGYASHFLSGKSLPINFSTWNHTAKSPGLDKTILALVLQGLWLVLRVSLLHSISPVGWHTRK